MRMMVCSVRQCRRVLLLAVCAAAVVMLMLFPQAAATGVKRGLAVCGQLLIPSLFPFMVLSGFLIRAGIAATVGRHLHPLTAKLLGLSGNASTALVISLLGGYPAGAAAVAGLCEDDHITVDEAKRLLCCCVNAGPAFVIGGIGAGMLGSAKAGVLLLAAHWAATLCVALVGRRQQAVIAASPAPAVNIGVAVTNSVNDACRSLIAMCGFVLCTSTVISLTDVLGGAFTAASGLRCALACLLEVSNGCMEIAAFGKAVPFLMGATLGFAGLSVFGQVAAVTANRPLITVAFWRARLLHALLGGCFSALLFRLCDPYSGAVPTAVVLSAVTKQTDTVSAAALLSIFLMCVIFLVTARRPTME